MRIYVLKNNMNDSMRSVLNSKAFCLRIDERTNRLRFYDIENEECILETSPISNITENDDIVTVITRSGSKYILQDITSSIGSCNLYDKDLVREINNTNEMRSKIENGLLKDILDGESIVMQCILNMKIILEKLRNM